ncbi:hypothetical protein BBP40_001702 [Aspergillus hancockii]|nr:hypothetical protein BBP40_001702 [Aspergillus hancockii]
MANTDKSASFSLQECQNQLSECMSTPSSTSMTVQAITTSTSTSDANTRTAQLAQTIIPYDDDYDLVCDLPGDNN